MAVNSIYVFPQEGLDYIMSVIPKGTTPSGIYLGLWGQSTASGSVWGTAPTGYTSLSGLIGAGTINLTLNSGATAANIIYEQATFSGYNARIGLTAGNWGAQTSTTVNVSGNSALPVRASTYPAVTITNSGSVTVSGIAGIFLCTNASGAAVGYGSGAALNVIWYSPFSDLNTVTLASGDSLSVTATWQQAAFQS